MDARAFRTGSIPIRISSRASSDRIFGASDWLYVCLEAEIPNPGDFKRSQLGNREVVAVRGSDGAINVLVNRCAHRSMQVLHSQSRFREGVRLPLSPMDL